MSRDILEQALNKTKEIEEENLKKMRTAQHLGRVIGIIAAVVIDSTAVWLIVKFLLGFASFSWISALGVMLLVSMLKAKFDQAK
jgi:hypothetical protein